MADEPETRPRHVVQALDDSVGETMAETFLQNGSLMSIGVLATMEAKLCDELNGISSYIGTGNIMPMLAYQGNATPIQAREMLTTVFDQRICATIGPEWMRTQRSRFEEVPTQSSIKSI